MKRISSIDVSNLFTELFSLNKGIGKKNMSLPFLCDHERKWRLNNHDNQEEKRRKESGREREEEGSRTCWSLSWSEMKIMTSTNEGLKYHHYTSLARVLWVASLFNTLPSIPRKTNSSSLSLVSIIFSTKEPKSLLIQLQYKHSYNSFLCSIQPQFVLGHTNEIA